MVAQVVLSAGLTGLALVHTMETNSYASNLSPAMTKVHNTQIHPTQNMSSFFLVMLVRMM